MSTLELVWQKRRRETIEAAVQQIFDNISGRSGLDMYMHRFGRCHACEVVIRWATANPPTLARAEPTPFAQAMPEQYRGECAVAAYRRYYAAEKLTLRGESTWRSRPRPEWAVRPATEVRL